MLFKYGSNHYKQLTDNLKEFFSNNQIEINEHYELKEIADILLNIMDDNNLDVLTSLDKLNLKFNSWYDTNEALNDNFLSNSNHILFSVYSRENALTITRMVIEAVYLTLYADIYEGSLIATDFHIKKTLKEYADSLVHSAPNLSSDSLKRINYLWFLIPKEVFTKHLDQHLDDKVLETVKNLQRNDVYITDKLTESNKLKADIDEIQKTLTEQKTEFNFVGLSDGFKTLKENKEKELTSEKATYDKLILAIIALITVKTIWSAYYLTIHKIDDSSFIVLTISTVLLIFVLLYFFKISLNNIKSLKSQILQVDLRLTLCQFIHNYNDDTKESRKNMKDSFDKFESVIFAPIVATEDKMPSTFDGVEQLTNIIGAIKK